MMRFKVGDRVKVVHYDKVWREYFGQTGCVTKIDNICYTVKFDDEKEIGWLKDELWLEDGLEQKLDIVACNCGFCGECTGGYDDDTHTQDELKETKEYLKNCHMVIEDLETTVVDQMKYIIELQQIIIEMQNERLMN